MRITTLLVVLGLSAFAATPAVRAQTQSSHTAPVWATVQDVDVLVAEMRSRLERGWLIDPPGNSALDLLRVLRERKADGPEVEELTRGLFDRMLRSGRAAMRAKALTRSAQFLQSAREVGANFQDPALEQAEVELALARQQYPDADIVF